METEMATQPRQRRSRCSLAAVLALLGERWTLLAVREMGYGVHRFDQIAAYTGASRDILANRLRTLTDAGVVERRRYSEHPPRYEYHLTEAGRELRPALLALTQWGDKWVVDRPATVFTHDCGHVLRVDHVCHHCGRPVTSAGVEATPATAD
jgi:DNA-binding HxlR family transcriptional regulator